MEYGFSNNELNKKHVKVINGKLAFSTTEDDEEAVKRTYEIKSGDNKGEKKTVYERLYDNATVIIDSASFDEKDFGPILCVDFNIPGDGEYQLRLPVSNRLFEQFAKRIPNIDKGEALTIGAFKNTDGQSVLHLRQNGTKVPMAFTKDKPNGMPAPIKKDKLGKIEWDYSDQVNFLYGVAKKWVDSFSPEEEIPY